MVSELARSKSTMAELEHGLVSAASPDCSTPDEAVVDCPIRACARRLENHDSGRKGLLSRVGRQSRSRSCRSQSGAHSVSQSLLSTMVHADPLLSQHVRKALSKSMNATAGLCRASEAQMRTVRRDGGSAVPRPMAMDLLCWLRCPEIPCQQRCWCRFSVPRAAVGRLAPRCHCPLRVLLEGEHKAHQERQAGDGHVE
jgi:hypothetical protein